MLGLAPQSSKAHEGVNLIPYLQGHAQNANKVTQPHEKLFWTKDVNSSMRDGSYKLVICQKRYALYNLATDLAELYDISAQHPDITKQMMTELQQWQQQFPAPLWDEGPAWSKITVEKHLAGLENRTVRFKNPAQMKKYFNKPL